MPVCLPFAMPFLSHPGNKAAAAQVAVPNPFIFPSQFSAAAAFRFIHPPQPHMMAAMANCMAPPPMSFQNPSFLPPPIHVNATKNMSKEGAKQQSSRQASAEYNSNTRARMESEYAIPICTCKNSQCLKLYCKCFASSAYCTSGVCRCTDCKNTGDQAHAIQRHQAIGVLLHRNPKAFQQKFVGSQGKVSNIQEKKSEEVRHKFGCRCKKSACLKKYCECYNAGVKCNADVCRCINCHNMGPSTHYDMDGKPSSTISTSIGIVKSTTTISQVCKQGTPLTDSSSGSTHPVKNSMQDKTPTMLHAANHLALLKTVQRASASLRQIDSLQCSTTKLGPDEQGVATRNSTTSGAKITTGMIVVSEGDSPATSSVDSNPDAPDPEAVEATIRILAGDTVYEDIVHSLDTGSVNIHTKGSNKSGSSVSVKPVQDVMRRSSSMTSNSSIDQGSVNALLLAAMAMRDGGKKSSKGEGRKRVNKGGKSGHTIISKTPDISKSIHKHRVQTTPPTPPLTPDKDVEELNHQENVYHPAMTMNMNALTVHPPNRPKRRRVVSKFAASDATEEVEASDTILSPAGVRRDRAAQALRCLANGFR